jgi:hypothetical protein
VSRVRARRTGRIYAPAAPMPATPTAASDLGRDIFVLGGLMLAIAVYRFIVLAQMPGPPGSDGGNWMAFTEGLFGHSPKAADSVYFPGTLVILKALLLFLPDLIALKTLAVLSSVVPAIPLYLLARRGCSVGVSAFVTLLFLMAGYLIEMMTWGGYPQLLATAYLLGAMFCLDRWLNDSDRRGLFWGAALVFLIVATHHFTALVFAAVMAVYVPFVLFSHRREVLSVVRRSAMFSGLAGAMSLLVAPWYLKYFSLLAGEGSLSAAKSQLGSNSNVISYVFAEAPMTWIALVVVGLCVSAFPLAGEGARQLRPIAVSLTLAPIAVFLATGESRALQLLQAGTLLSLGLLFTFATHWMTSRRLSVPVVRIGIASQALAALVLLMVLLPNGHARFEDAVDRYGALDADAIQALDWLRDSTPESAVVLPGHRNAWVSYAWWVEGLAQRPAYGLLDPDFLAFKQEHEQSALAARLVDPATTAEETQQILDETGIDYLFIYKPTGGAFQSLADRVPVYVSYQNAEFVILHFTDQTADARP